MDAIALQHHLDSQRVARLGTVDSDGRPHVIPICFAYREGYVYSALDTKPKRVPAMRLRRVANILANPNVQVLIDEYREDWSTLRYVQLRGLAEVMLEGRETEEARELLATKYEQYRGMDLSGRPVIKVTVKSVRIWGWG